MTAPAPAPAVPAASDAVLALDLGTSSLRVLAFDAHGEPLADFHAARRHEARATPDGGSELDAEPLLDAAVACLRSVSDAVVAAGHRIRAVGLCTFWHAVLAVDEAGAPLTPVLLWNDMRAADAARRLQGVLNGAAVHRRTGCVLHPSYLPARLAWLREARPDAYAAAACFLSVGEWFERCWFGAPRCGLSMASGTGLLDQRRQDWDPAILTALALPAERLSPLVATHAPAQGLRSPYAEALPALRNVPFFPALGDGACSNLGSGATRPDTAALMVGTSAAARVFFAQDGPPAPEGLWRYLLDGERALIGGALSNGGNLIAWLRRTLQLPPEAELDAALLGAAPGGHGLQMLPFLTGERNPDYPLQAAGVLAGLTAATGPVEIVQAAMEAVTFRLAAISDRLALAQPRLTHFIASGQLRSPAWLHLLADVLGRPIQRSTVSEASSRGAALLALEALGLLPVAAHDLPAPLGERIEPDPARHAAYAAPRAAHEALYRQCIAPGV